MIAGVHPGMIYAQDYAYNPRWYYGQPGDIKVVSCLAIESILPGCLVETSPVQDNPNHILVRMARGGAQPIVGVAVFDPNHFDSSVVYQINDQVPVLRHGACFCAYVVNLPPFADPQPCQPARFYPGDGTQSTPVPAQFTTDTAGILIPQIVFQVATKDYYPNTDGSPQADIPLPIPVMPSGSMDTTFGTGCALVEVNLGV